MGAPSQAVCDPRATAATQGNGGSFLHIVFDYGAFRTVLETGVDDQRRFDAHIEVYGDEPGDVQLRSLTPPAAPYNAVSMQTLPKVLGGNHSGPSVTVATSTKAPLSGTFFAESDGLPRFAASVKSRRLPA